MATSAQDKEVTGLLRDVSRSFYLTLRVLPRAVRSQIGLAYLLARATDTIADTDVVPVAERLSALEQLRARILDPATKAPDLKRYAVASTETVAGYPDQAKEQPSERIRSATPAEAVLLSRTNEAIAFLDRLDPTDRELIREVLCTITGGQELDLRRFANAKGDRIVALRNDAELDDYTYRVAGCVGEFWTKLCRRRLFSAESIDDAGFLADGVRFGKGLQLVNILRDLPRDLQHGRCYLPADRLGAARVKPTDLIDGAAEPLIRPLYDEYLSLARGHLLAGWNYTLTIPYRCVRLRLACAWPILIGIRTIEKLRSSRCLDAHRTVKISRKEVRVLIFRSVITYPIPSLWKKLFGWAETSSSKPIASRGIFQ